MFFFVHRQLLAPNLKQTQYLANGAESDIRTVSFWLYFNYIFYVFLLKLIDLLKWIWILAYGAFWFESKAPLHFENLCNTHIVFENSELILFRGHSTNNSTLCKPTYLIFELNKITHVLHWLYCFFFMW